MNKLSSILGIVAVLAITFVFVVQFQPANKVANVDSGPKCVADVHGKCVPSNQFWAAYRLIMSRGVDAGRARSMGLRRLAAEGLLEQWLLNEDAKRLGVTVSDDDVSAEIVQGRAHLSLPADKLRQLAYPLSLGEDGVAPLAVKDRKTKRFDAKNYEKDVRLRTKLSPTEFREYQKAELIASRMRDLVRERVHVGDNEAYDQFAREKATVTLDYVKFDRRFYADTMVDVSPAAVQAWSDKNKDELEKVWEARKKEFLPECRVSRHILAKVDQYASDEKKAAAKKKIEDALARVNGGEDFGAVARELSDDGSAADGGMLGCVTKGKMVKPFEDALFALGEGKTSGVVESDFGYHIIKVDKIAKDADAEKAGRSQIARERYIGLEADRLAAEGAKKVLASVRAGKPVKDAVDAYLVELAAAAPGAAAPASSSPKDKKKKDEKPAEEKVDAKVKPTVATHPDRPAVESTMPFNVSAEPISGARQGTDIAKIAFELKKVGDVPNDIIPMETGFAIAQLKEKAEASKEAWDKEREFYVSKMLVAKQQDALGEYIQRLRAQLASDVKFNTDLTTEPKAGKGEAETPEGPAEE